jgi:hypothetical protein
MKIHSLRTPKAFLVSLLAVSFAMPVQSAIASPIDEQASAASQSQSASETIVRAQDAEVYDGSTNCYPEIGDVPFISGVVKDVSGNPLAGARVIAKIFSGSSVDRTTEQYVAYATKSDGSYSLCAYWDDNPATAWSTTFGKLQSQTATLIMTVQPPTSSLSRTSATTLAGMSTASPASVTSDIDNRCLKPASLSTPCLLNVTLRTPVVQATVKKQDGSVFAESNVAIEYKLAGIKWTNLADIQANKEGWFGLAGFATSNNFRVRVKPPSCAFEDLTLCPELNGLGSAADNLAVIVATPGNPATASGTWESTASNTKAFTILPANFSGTLKNSDSTTVTGMVQVVATQSSTQKVQDLWTGDGKYALTLDDGAWVVAVSGDDALIKSTSFNVTASNGVVTSISKVGGSTVCSSATTVCARPQDLTIDPVNFMAIIKDDLGTTVRNAWLNVSRYDPVAVPPSPSMPYVAGSSSGDPASQWAPRQAGLVGVDLAVNTIYEMRLSPPYEGDYEVTEATYLVKTFADGANLKVQRCAAWNRDPQITPCTSGFSVSDLSNAANTLARVDGKFSLVMPTANFKGVLCSPEAGCVVVGNAYINISRLQENQQCQNCGPNYLFLPGGQVRADGTFSLTITQAGKYRFEVDAPYAQPGDTSTVPFAKTRLAFEAVSNGSGGYQYFTLDSTGTRTTTQLATTAVPNKGTRVLFKYLAPSLVGLVQAPDGTVSGNSWVEVQKETPRDNCLNCTENSSAGVNSNGIFGLSVTAGRFNILANPSWNLESQNLTKTKVSVSALDCNSDGVIEIYTYESTQCSNAVSYPLINGKVVITLRGANFAGVVKRPDTNAIVPYGNIGVEKWLTAANAEGGYWQWANKGTSAKSTGVFGINFDEVGKYRVNFNVPFELQSSFSTSQVIVNVAGTGTLTVTPVVDSSIWQADGNGGYVIKFRLPNVSGRVTLPDGSPLAVGTYANIQAEKWQTSMCGEGCYQWSSELNGISTNSSGDYAMSVPAGRWRLTYNPPYGTSSYARTTREIVVTSTDVCLLSNAVNSTCPGTKILPGAMNVSLATPNYSGVVKNPDTTVSPWTSVQIQKLNSTTGYWEWSNGMSTDSLGRFSVNLTESKTYKMIFDASFSASGVSPATKYIRVCGDGASVSSIANEAAAKTGSTCATSGALRDQTIDLLGSNVRGIVKDTSGTALQDVWISILNCGTGTAPDFCNWEKGTNTKTGSNLGKFDLRLNNDAPRNVTKFNIEMNPPWNSSTGLVRVVKTIWVKDFNANGEDDWCLDANYTPGANGGTCSSVGLPTTNWDITMTAGNLAGKVLAPTGSTAIVQAQIQIERWAKPDWDPTNGSYGWQWTNMWANANQSGVFGLDITTAGLYRISVSPGWDNSAGYARKRSVVRVNSSGDWCVKSGLTSASAVYPVNTDTPDDDTCQFGRDNDANDGVTGLGLRVSSSNLRGVVYTSSTNLSSSTDLADDSKKIRDAWIGIQKKTAQGWWEWQGGVNTSGSANSKGMFAANIEVDGDYKFEFNPSWMSTGEDAGFTIEFNASGCSVTCQFTGISGSNIELTANGYMVKYLAPNFSGTVLDKTGINKIAGSWISVMNTSTGQWIGGVSTGWNGANQGKFALRLGNGTYRVEVNPRWDDATSGIRRVMEVVVVGGNVTTCSTTGCVQSGTSWNISLMGETVSGKVYYPGAADTSSDTYASATTGNQTVMAWAWAEVRSCTDNSAATCNDYVESQNSNQSGVIKFGLADSATPYLIRIYSNWSLYAGSPLEILVKVVNGSSTWKYRAETGNPYVSSAFTPDFGRIPPNVSITISGVTSSRYVDLYKCSEPAVAGACGTGWVKVATVLSSADNTDWKANFLISDATDYKVVVIRQTGDVGTNGAVFTYNGTNPISQIISL